MTSNMLTSSKEECTIFCLRANGCLAAIVTPADDVMMCNLVTGPSDENDFVEDAASEVFVLGESICFYISHMFQFLFTRE